MPVDVSLAIIPLQFDNIQKPQRPISAYETLKSQKYDGILRSSLMWDRLTLIEYILKNFSKWKSFNPVVMKR